MGGVKSPFYLTLINMTTEELIKDLKSKTNPHNNCFKVKLFKRDLKIYDRRTFDDLFLYYRKYGITEKQLMKGLIDAGFSALYCSTVERPTFAEHKSFIKYWTKGISEHYILEFNRKITKNTKYNVEYLDKLYNSI
jgi:hypothetical protein